MLGSGSDCFHYLLHKNIVLPGNISVIIMPKDTLECTELHHLKNNVSQPSNHLTIYCIATPPIRSKKYTTMFELELQAKQLSSLFFVDNIIILHFNVLLLNTIMYTKHFHLQIHIM